VRDTVKVSTVYDLNGGTEFAPIDGGIGYIRLSQFGEHTGQELEEALRKQEKQGLQSLILDLRDNPGGLLDQAVEVCKKFLPRDQIVVTTEGRQPEDRSEFRTTRRGRFAGVTLAVLVNRGSASASEIVAACLQDSTTNGAAHAVIIGERTFGKGSVQKIIPFPTGDALRLTTAKYYSPNRRVIHTVGVLPDIVIELSAQEEEARLARARRRFDGSAGNGRDRIAELSDPQLDRAIEVLKGIQLLGNRMPAPKRVAALPESQTSEAP
jgi:carboxyl-terminal processing protease